MMVDAIMEQQDKPDVFMKPPKLYGIALLAGFALDLVFPMSLFAFWVQFAFGIPLMCAGIALAVWGIRTFQKAETNVPTDMPVTALVTTGPYKFARNPIYIGLTTLYIGIAMFCDWPLALLLLLPVLYLMDTKVVAAEEEYLERKFGAAYADYKNRVRRWGTY